MAVIELDLYAPVGTGRVRVPPARRYRWAGLVAVAILLLTLGGAATVAAPRALHPGGHVPFDRDTDFGVVGGRLYTFQPVEGSLTTTAWAIDPVRRLWSTTTQSPQKEAFDTASHYVYQAGSDTLLLTNGTISTVLDAATGRALWSTPRTLTLLLDDRTALENDETFRPGTELTEDDVPDGGVYGSGPFYREPPTRTVVRALDLRTGRQRWTQTRTGQVTAQQSTDDRGTVVLESEDRLTAVAAGTGRILRERKLPATGYTSTEVIDGMVLVRQGAPNVRGTITVYAVRTFGQLWQGTQSADWNGDYFCSGVLCDTAGDRAVVLDLATGRPRWTASGGYSLVGRGSEVLEISPAGDRPILARDLATGAIRTDFGPWSWYAYGVTGGPLLVGRPDPKGGTTFGVQDPGGRAVRGLGHSKEPVTDCRADDRYIVCRTTAGLSTWSYLS